MNKPLNFLLSSIVAFAFCNSAFAEKRESGGWTPLFNGNNFDGWYIISGQRKKNEDTNHLFQIHDGMVHMYKDAEDKSKQPNGYIVTDKEYSNYHLRFEYKWGTKKFGDKVNAK